MSWLATTVALAGALWQQGVPLHPLDPLTSGEIAVARDVLHAAGKLTRELRFASLALREPPKDSVLQSRASGGLRRIAEGIAYDWATSTPYRTQVDLTSRRVLAWETLPSREPPSRAMIRRRLEEIARQDPRWSGALRQHAIADPSRVLVIPSLGESAPLPWVAGDRVVWAAALDQEAIGASGLLAGLRLEVNLTRGSVLQLLNPGGGRRTPDPERMPDSTPARPAPPGGPIALDGSALRWRNWRLHFGVHPRRGLELWDIAWQEGDRKRPVLYRASVSEAMAAYGDPDFTVWYPRDAGNAGLGDYQRNAILELLDAPGGALLVDAVFADEQLRPVPTRGAVAIYERDGGLLWRHAGQARRGRQLVLSNRATIDNYDFLFNWIFAEDGRIEVEVQLTGVMLFRRERPERSAAPHRAFAHLVAPGIFAPNHQHFFSFRLDFDVDGATPNRVMEQESVRIPQGRPNPEGLWFAMHETLLASESGARRNLHTAASRKWRVINPAQHNSLGQAAGYTLVPGEVAIPYATPRSAARRANGFVGAQLWVTPYRRDEMHAAGDFVNFSSPAQGLPGWSAANRGLVDRDVVLWYTLGVTHIPRPEDYPVMPAHRASFQLIPTGFFSANPALKP